MRNVVGQSFGLHLSEHALHGPIFQGVERDDADSGSWSQPVRTGRGSHSASNGVEKGVKIPEFVVHRDPDRLESSGRRVDAPRGWTPRGRTHDPGQFTGRGYRMLSPRCSKFSGDRSRTAFLPVLADHSLEFGLRERSEEFGRREGQRVGCPRRLSIAGRSRKSHVEGPVMGKGEPPLRIVHLAGGEAQIGQNHIRATTGLGQPTRKRGEVPLLLNHRRAVPAEILTDSIGGVTEVSGIYIVENEYARGPDHACKGNSMPAEPRRAVDDRLAARRRKKPDRFIKEYWDVRRERTRHARA